MPNSEINKPGSGQERYNKFLKQIAFNIDNHVTNVNRQKYSNNPLTCMFGWITSPINAAQYGKTALLVWLKNHTNLPPTQLTGPR